MSALARKTVSSLWLVFFISRIRIGIRMQDNNKIGLKDMASYNVIRSDSISEEHTASIFRMEE
jgi:hypothetical protein